jgi:hypothetical protein
MLNGTRRAVQQTTNFKFVELTSVDVDVSPPYNL